MKSIEYHFGDALNPIQNSQSNNIIIAHICNDIGKWGKGFVVSISKKYPHVEQSYRDWYRGNEFTETEFKLGAVDFVLASSNKQQNIWIANMIAQHMTKPIDNIPPIRYNALLECLSNVSSMALKLNASVHMPKIGTGLAGGSWSIIEPIIHTTLCEKDIPVYVYLLPTKTTTCQTYPIKTSQKLKN